MKIDKPVAAAVITALSLGVILILMQSPKQKLDSPSQPTVEPVSAAIRHIPKLEKKTALLAKPVTPQEAWSPTYRAAREAGYDPKQAQGFSTICQKAQEIERSAALCVGADLNPAQQAYKLKLIQVAVKAYIASEP